MADKTNNKKSGAGSTIITIVLVIAIIFAIMCSYAAYTTKAGSGVPSLFGIEPFAVQSDSMAPFFNKGDLVIDTKVKDPSALKEGDIITFWTVINGYKVLNTHRIVEVQDYGDHYYYVTKGDANPINDTVGVHSNDVVGQYKTHIKKVGGVLDFLQTGKGFFCCIVIPVGIFFIYQLIAFFKTLALYRTEKIKFELQQEAAAAANAAANIENKEEKEE